MALDCSPCCPLRASLQQWSFIKDPASDNRINPQVKWLDKYLNFWKMGVVTEISSTSETKCQINKLLLWDAASALSGWMACGCLWFTIPCWKLVFCHNQAVKCWTQTGDSVIIMTGDQWRVHRVASDWKIHVLISPCFPKRRNKGSQQQGAVSHKEPCNRAKVINSWGWMLWSKPWL